MKKFIHTIHNRLFSPKLLIFINFKGIDGPYGGGNTFVKNLSSYLTGFNDVEITYTLKKDIDIYLIIDIRKGANKKYSFAQILEQKIKNKKGAIVARINDCDITRENKSLEKSIIEHFDKIDYYIFNSEFIRSYYLAKYPLLQKKINTVVYNTSNSRFFFPVQKRKLSKDRIKIVTHHWSDNFHKGYDFYFKLFNYCKSVEHLEFIFIGRKFNDQYISQLDDMKVCGPFKDMELADQIRNCDIYISASVYDACPMHVLEGISCGLPILYIDHDGGGKNICELSKQKIGEAFTDFDDFLIKLNLIVANYDKYVSNIIENINLYNSENCYHEYNSVFRDIQNQFMEPSGYPNP